jgi:hypothetical protein
MENNDSIELQSNSKRARIVINLTNLSTDHCLKKKLINYHPSDIDNIHRTYLQKKLLVNIFNYFLFIFSIFFYS